MRCTASLSADFLPNAPNDPANQCAHSDSKQAQKKSIPFTFRFNQMWDVLRNQNVFYFQTIAAA